MIRFHLNPIHQPNTQNTLFYSLLSCVLILVVFRTVTRFSRRLTARSSDDSFVWPTYCVCDIVERRSIEFAVCYKRNIEARSRNHFCRGKARSTTYSECVSVALVNQHAKSMHRSILSSVACLALPYFSHYLINGTILVKKKVIEHKMCVLIFSTTFVWNIFHSKKSSARYWHKCT